MNTDLVMADRLVNQAGIDAANTGEDCPHCKINDIRNFCLWMAGFNDKALELGLR